MKYAYTIRHKEFVKVLEFNQNFVTTADVVAVSSKLSPSYWVMKYELIYVDERIVNSPLWRLVVK